MGIVILVLYHDGVLTGRLLRLLAVYVEHVGIHVLDFDVDW